MQLFITALYITVCVLLVLVVLLQRGKDSSGDLFGVGANAVLSSQGTTSFLVRLTTALGVMFFLLSVLLGYTINKSLDRVTFYDVAKHEAGQQVQDSVSFTQAGSSAQLKAQDSRMATGVSKQTGAASSKAKAKKAQRKTGGGSSTSKQSRVSEKQAQGDKG